MILESQTVFISDLIDLMRTHNVDFEMVCYGDESSLDINFKNNGYIETESNCITPELLESLVLDKRNHSCK